MGVMRILDRPEFRWVRSGAMLTALGAAGGVACNDVPDVPVAGPYPGSRAAVTVEPGFLEYPTPAESLYVHPRSEDAGVSLLFYRGRGVARDGKGAAYLADATGSRVLVLDEDLRVARTVGDRRPSRALWVCRCQWRPPPRVRSSLWTWSTRPVSSTSMRVEHMLARPTLPS